MTKIPVIREADKILAVIEQKSISRAAKSLGISQSSLSRVIQEFETDLGVELFIRTSQGVEVTEAGKICADYLLRLKEAEEDLRKGLDFLKSSFMRLNIALPLHMGADAVMEIESKVREEYPDAQLHITNVFSGKVPSGLLSDKYDFAISWKDGGDDPRLSFEPFYDDHFLLLVPNKLHVPSRRETVEGREIGTVDLDVLQTLPFVLQDERTSIRATINQFCSKHAIILQNCLTVGNSMVAISAVKNGIGCAFVMEAYSPFFRNSEDVSVYYMPEDVEETIGLLKLSRKTLSPVEEYAARVIRDYLEERRLKYSVPREETGC